MNRIISIYNHSFKHFSRSFSLLLLILSLLGLSFITYPVQAATPAIRPTADFMPGQVLVKFKNTKALSSSGQTAQVAGFRLNQGQQISSLNIVQYRFGNQAAIPISIQAAKDQTSSQKYIARQELEKVIKVLRQDPQVEIAQPNYILKASQVPNDPFRIDQWGLNNTGQAGGTNDIDINAYESFDVTEGNSGTIVAVIDSGVNLNHPDLADNILRNSNGQVVGYDYVNEDADPSDDEGHGTHVAGIIAARTNNATGVAGICGKCKIMPVKSLNAQGVGGTLEAIRAITFATNNGASVINTSWGGYEEDSLLTNVVNNANAKNIVFVASAGNDNTSDPVYPASSNFVISVAAVNRTGAKAGFSNFGQTIDVTAPGDRILATFPPGSNLAGGCGDNTYSTGNDGYGYCSGTSMSAPMVSGCAALLKSVKPSLNSDQVEGILKQSAKDLGAAGRDNNFGSGLINCRLALDSVLPCPTGQFNAEYFSRVNFTDLALAKCEPKLDFIWGEGKPAPQVAGNDNFSARFIGNLNLSGGAHTFRARGDDNVKVWVDDQLIIDNTGRAFYKTYKANITLAAGVHTVRVEYFDSSGFALLKLNIT